MLYLVAGRTHPEVARLEGEQYRLLLERRAVDLGVADHVEFDDRFLSVPELADLLHATDVFLTPYRNPEQIASGALTFAIAAGCAAISTPYLFAKDMLATGAGKLVPFDDVAAIESAVSGFIESPESLAAARAEARRIGTELAWPAIAAETAVVLQEAALARPRREPIPIVELELTSVRTDHLRTLVDDVGIIQHATGVIPSWETGYCVDDVARLAGRRARAHRAHPRSAVDTGPPSLARLPAIRYRARGHRDAELHGLRPTLARRAACRRPCRQNDLGAR